MYMYILTCKNRLEKKSEKLSTNAKEYMNATRGKKATTTTTKNLEKVIRN